MSPGTTDVSPPALCQQIFTRAITVSLAPRRTEVMQWGGGPHCITSVLRGRVEGGRGQRVLLDSCRSCIFWFLVETPGGPPEASCNFFLARWGFGEWVAACCSHRWEGVLRSECCRRIGYASFGPSSSGQCLLRIGGPHCITSVLRCFSCGAVLSVYRTLGCVQVRCEPGCQRKVRTTGSHLTLTHRFAPYLDAA